MFAHTRALRFLQLLGVFLSSTAAVWSAQIGGVVRDKETGRGIARVTVRAVSVTSPSHEYETITDRNGSFVVKVVGGRYRVNALPTGTNYMPGFYRDPKAPADAGVVELVAEDVFTFADISLDRGGSIAGRVTRRADGMALENVRVTAESDSFRAVATTDKHGNYVLRALPSGPYVVQAGVLDSSYIPMFYPRTPSRDRAELISIGPGTRASGIDVGLEYGASIRGRILSATTNQPIPDIMIIATPIEGSDPERYAYTDQAGFYSMTGLMPGKYTLEAGDERTESPEGTRRQQYVTQYFDQVFDRELAKQVELETGSTIAGIDFSLYRSNHIRGVIHSNFYNQPLPDVVVIPVPTKPSKLKMPTASSDAHGAYVVNDLPPGTYWVTVNLPEGSRQYVPTWYRDQVTLKRATPLVLADGDTYSNVDFNLKLGGSVSGRVAVDDQDYPLDFGRLHLVLSTVNNEIDGFEPRVNELNQEGEYSIVSAPPGRFHLTVQSEDPNLILGPGTDTKTVIVSEGRDQREVNFDLKVGGSISGRVILRRSHVPLDKYRILALRVNEPYHTFVKIKGDQYVVPGMRPGKYVIVLVEETEPMTLEKLFSGPRWYDSRIVEVKHGVEAAGVDFIIDETQPLSLPQF